jgi:hypothetical protein
MTTYGVEFYNANGDVQIASDTTGKGFIVTYEDQGTVTPRVNLSKELVFARPAATTANYYFYAELSTADVNGEKTISFVNDLGNATTSDYFIVTPSDDLTASSSGYGIQVYNSEGDLTFDSGTVTSNNGGVNITDYFAAGIGSGDYDLLDTDERKYALMNTSFFDQDTFETGFYYANTTSPFVSQNGVYYVGQLYVDFGQGVQVSDVGNLGAILLAERGSV